jgi:3-keto-5-aminohexanoate cleavage enzyme
LAKVIIEAAITGNRARADNPNLPVTAEEVGRDAAACVEAGASVIHIHSRDPVTEEPVPEDARPYAAAIRAIRARCRPLIWPSTPAGENPKPTPQRFGFLADLARDPETRPDMAGLDMGTLNWTKVTGGRVGGHVYVNRVQQLEEVCRFVGELGYPRTRLQMFDPNCLRTTLAFLKLGLLTEPLAVTLYFGGENVLVGFPPSLFGLQAYADMLKGVHAVWFASVMGADVLELAPLAISLGGHIRVGLEDYAYPDATPQPSNADLVARAVGIIRAMGHEVATIEDAREILGVG